LRELPRQLRALSRRAEMIGSRISIRYIMSLNCSIFLITLQNWHGKTERSFKSFVLACSGKRKRKPIADNVLGFSFPA
jgi:hypothetical protein